MVNGEPVIAVIGHPALQRPRPGPAPRAVLAASPGPFVRHRAGELTRAACRAGQLDDLADAAVMVAGELVTNAVVHAQTFLELHVVARRSEVVVAVHDRDPGFEAGWWDRHDESGRPWGARYGLWLTRTLADRYGAFEHPAGGKVMWAALATGLRAPDGDGVGGRAWSVLPVRRVIAVNGARRVSASGQRSPWRLDLLLGWLAHEPDHVDLTLRSTPLHPGLPHGNWRTGLDTLRHARGGSSSHDDVRFHPGPDQRTVLLELFADGRSQLVQCPVRELQAFLDAVHSAGWGF